MALKQVEYNYNNRKLYGDREPIRQDMSDKLKGYGEGVVHGWEAAAAEVAKATNGLFTLKEPPEISEWRARLKRAK